MATAEAFGRSIADPGPGRREQRRQEIRGRIEAAAYRLFKRDGIDDTSIEQICQQADVARRTFYGHYPNKQVLLQSLSRSRVWGTADQMIREIVDNHRATGDRLGVMIDYMAKNIRGYQAIDRALILITPGSLDGENHLRDVSDSLQHQLTTIFRAGQEVGDTTCDYSAELLAEMVVGTINTLLVNWAVDADYPVFDKLGEARQLFARVICTD